MERGWSVYVAYLVVFIIANCGAALLLVWLDFCIKTRTKFRWQWCAPGDGVGPQCGEGRRRSLPAAGRALACLSLGVLACSARLGR